jgi:hypothetical protein
MLKIVSVKEDLLGAVQTLNGELWEQMKRSAETKDDRKIDILNSFLKRTKSVLDEINLLLNDLEREFGEKSQIRHVRIPQKDVIVFFRNGRPTKINILGDEIEIRKQNEIPFSVANWLLNHGKHIPEIPNFIHKNKADFKMRSASLKQLKDGRFIEIGDHKERLLEKTRKLLDICGISGEVKIMEE